MKIHTAKIDITPSLERAVYLAGFASNKPATRVESPLWARCLLIEAHDKVVAWVMVDVIGLDRGVSQEIQAQLRAQIPNVDLLLATTHTHFGPDTIGLWGPSETERGVDPLYYEALKTSIHDVVVAAHKNPALPCHFRSASVTVKGVAKNYRDEHITDEEATCLQFVSEGGESVATWVIYPCHPEAVTYDWTDITSDYGHGLRETLEQNTGGMAFFSVGALGGMMSPTPTDQTHEQTYQMGATIANAALNALADAPLQAQPTMDLARHEVRFLLENPQYVMASQLGLVPDRRDEHGHLTTELNVFRLGDTALVTMPGELFPRMGLEAKALLRSQGARVAGVVGLVNDELGYLLHPDDFVFPEDYSNPGKQYEESMSPGPKAIPALWEKLERR
jgi:hypothetical protein